MMIMEICNFFIWISVFIFGRYFFWLAYRELYCVGNMLLLMSLFFDITNFKRFFFRPRQNNNLVNTASSFWWIHCNPTFRHCWHRLRPKIPKTPLQTIFHPRWWWQISVLWLRCIHYDFCRRFWKLLSGPFLNKF